MPDEPADLQPQWLQQGRDRRLRDDGGINTDCAIRTSALTLREDGTILLSL